LVTCKTQRPGSAIDRDISKVLRPDVNEFVEWLRDPAASGRKVSTTTVGRYITTLRAAFARAILENSLGIENVFMKVEIKDQGKDAKDRETFTADQYRHLYAALDQWAETKGLDPLRCILTLVAETGARLAEVVGLAAADVDLAGAAPSLRIAENPWWPLKTPGSARNVPLSPRAVEAAKVALRLRGNAVELFPGRAGKTDSVSATLVKWVREREGLQGTKLGNHSLRHGMKDRLRAIQCSDSIQDAILGHVTPGVGAGYGQGYPLSVLAEWVTRALSLENPKDPRRPEASRQTDG
jgi:integrase